MKDPRHDRDDLAALCEGLLWDVPADAVSWDEHRDFVIGRVLARGKLSQIKRLRQRVGDDALRGYIARTRGRAVDSRRLRFFETILELPVDQVDAWLSDPARRIWDER
jgi:hypothetical protein